MSHGVTPEPPAGSAPYREALTRWATGKDSTGVEVVRELMRQRDELRDRDKAAKAVLQAIRRHPDYTHRLRAIGHGHLADKLDALARAHEEGDPR